MSVTALAVLIIIAGVIFLIFFLWAVPIPIWISAKFAGVKVRPIRDLVAMRIRRVPPGLIVKALISAQKAGINLTPAQLEAHHLAGGRVMNVVNALIAADKAGIPLSFERAAAIDLAGRDVLEAVQMSVTPKVITSPWITAVAKDGIQVKVIARITVRANIEKLVGGAGEETVIARVGEGVVTAIGSANSYKDVLENPDIISKTVLDKGLDAETAFEILSIDIADVDVGENIGAKLLIDKANAELKVARAKAEERLAMAQAREQEMRALAQKMRAKVAEAQAQVPRAIAEAIRAGRIVTAA
ncbi:UPF0365 family protein [Candidatus Poribacteria bacterium]|nr:MAG: UPF0365 family protein [Candidatus Poribacteria bacterium]